MMSASFFEWPVGFFRDDARRRDCGMGPGDDQLAFVSAL